MATGVDLGALIGVARWLEDLLGRRLEGQVYRAGELRGEDAGSVRERSISASE